MYVQCAYNIVVNSIRILNYKSRLKDIIQENNFVDS